MLSFSDLLSDEEFSNDTSEEDDEEDDAEELARLKAEAAEKLVAPLGEGEYGVMPAKAYENSQAVSAPTIGGETVPTADGEDSGDAEPAQIAKKEKPVRRPILMRDKYDGVDSDDESESEDDDGILRNPDHIDDEESDDEDRPTVVGEIEVDMEAEEEEFLKFSREALGISEGQWEGILKERAERGGECFACCFAFDRR